MQVWVRALWGKQLFHVLVSVSESELPKQTSIVEAGVQSTPLGYVFIFLLRSGRYQVVRSLEDMEQSWTVEVFSVAAPNIRIGIDGLNIQQICITKYAGHWSCYHPSWLTVLRLCSWALFRHQYGLKDFAISCCRNENTRNTNNPKRFTSNSKSNDLSLNTAGLGQICEISAAPFLVPMHHQYVVS